MLTHGALHGHRRTLYTVAGGALGFVLLIALSLAGIGVVEIVVEVGLAMLAHRVRPLLERLGRRFNRACGGMFMAMGVALPVVG